MREWQPEHKAAAKALIGRPARLALAAWILERGEATFYQTEALDGVSAAGVTRSAVYDELQLFTRWGLVERSGPPHGAGRVWYGADKHHPVWSIFQAAAIAFELIELEEP